LFATKLDCRHLAGGSYSLELTCRESEARSRAAVVRQTVRPEIWRYCLGLINDSYSLLETCVASEERDKRRLPPSGGKLIEMKLGEPW